MNKKPEVMSPAGGWPQLKAAVANGADAVYLGLSAFSARARATNFDPTDGLPKAVQYCHRYGVKVYVALNTLVFDSELEEVAQLVHQAALAGVDALIIQDLGVAKLVKDGFSSQAIVAAAREHRGNNNYKQQHLRIPPIHSSTQQTVTDSHGVEFCAQQHGATRVVLGRELSVSEMAKVTTETDVEVEAFVHGALCVSYSGQCFSSEAWGGRSANRGQCAQACRLPYGLVVDGQVRDTQDMKYLLSPQDLCGLDQVPDLIRAGISCLKIEGRLKDAEYVAATTRAYRNAVDEAWKQLVANNETQCLDATDAKASATEATVREKSLESRADISREELTQLFSRGQDETYTGLTPGFLEGTFHQRLVRGRSPRHRGVHVGRVAEGSSWKNGLLIQTSLSTLTNQAEMQEVLKLGDGIVVDRGMAQEEELGGPIFDIEELDDNGLFRVQLSREVARQWRQYDQAARRSSRKPFAPAGAHIWKTHDVAVEKRFRVLSEAQPPRLPVQVRVSGKIGEPIRVTISDGRNTSLEAYGTSDGVLVVAETSGLAPEKVRKAVGTLGNSRWVLDGDVDVSTLDTPAWCPMSWIKEARRRAMERWESLHEAEHGGNKERQGGCVGTSSEIPSTPGLRQSLRTADRAAEIKVEHTGPKLSVLCRNQKQVEIITRMMQRDSISRMISEVTVDFLELDRMETAVEMIKRAGARVIVASPRILKPNEGGLWKTLLQLEPDGLLVRSTGLLYKLTSLGGTGARVNVGVQGEEHFVEIPQLIGDFSLNAANSLTALELLHSGLSRITASYDLSANSIADMGSLMGGHVGQLEVVAHCKMPIFHTEHCVFARFLSKGNSFVDCGHACTRFNVHLRDQSGADNLVLADMGCRNTVFTAQGQSGIHSIPQWIKSGIQHFRLELVDEREEDCELLVRSYLDVMAGRKKASEAWRSLEQIRDGNGRESGVGLGSFRNTAERRAGELAP